MNCSKVLDFEVDLVSNHFKKEFNLMYIMLFHLFNSVWLEISLTIGMKIVAKTNIYGQVIIESLNFDCAFLM